MIKQCSPLAVLDSTGAFIRIILYHIFAKLVLKSYLLYSEEYMSRKKKTKSLLEGQERMN